MKNNGTLTLSEQDVAGKTLSQVLNDVGAASKIKKVMSLELPFNPDLYEGAGKGKDAWKSTWWGNDKGKVLDPAFMMREAIASLLRRGDFKDLKELRLTSMEGLDLDAFQRDVNKMLKTRNIDRRVNVDKGVITFEQHTSMPTFESETRNITTSFDAENKPAKKSMLTLKWTDEWTKWFADPTTDFGEFIEALAEHPEILCVDFSLMAKDSDGHKKYLTEDAVKQLLKVYDVRFICRYMPKEKKGTFEDWKTWGNQCRLSFVKCNGEIAQLHFHGDKKNTTEEGDGGWLPVYSEGRYVVAKTERKKTVAVEQGNFEEYSRRFRRR